MKVTGLQVLLNKEPDRTLSACML